MTKETTGAAAENQPLGPPQGDPQTILRQWRQAERYNDSIGLADEVQKSEDFYTGDQWKGLNAPDLDKPVFNILKRVGNFFIASIVSDDIGVRLEAFDSQGAEIPSAAGGAIPAAALGARLPAILSRQLEEAMELMKIKPLHRYFLRDSLVDGDGCIHFYFDPDRDPQGFGRGWTYTPGSIACELLDNTSVYFGNPQSAEVESQPWLIIQFRVPVEQARERARAAGSAEWQQIVADRDSSGANLEQEEGKTAVLRKYWLEGGARKSLWYAEADSRGHVVTPARETRQTRYPLVWMPWERVKNRYHGKGAVSALLPNQLAINKLYAMAMESVKKTAFPKVLYNRTMVPQWSNRVGEAIAVNGDPNQAIASSFKAAEMSPQLVALLSNVMSATRDTMGATDASLGNVKPENTSAILAVQKASSMPLDLQKQDFYRVVEEEIRIWLDMMAACYGVRPVRMTRPGAQPGSAQDEQVVALDFSGLGDIAMKLNVDIGGASYWSEITEASTLEKLFESEVIDAVQYVERMPEGCIREKNSLLDELRAQRETQQALQAALAAPEAPAGMETLDTTGGDAIGAL